MLWSYDGTAVVLMVQCTVSSPATGKLCRGRKSNPEDESGATGVRLRKEQTPHDAIIARGESLSGIIICEA